MFDLSHLISTKFHLFDHDHVSPLKAGSWVNDGHLHTHSPSFFQHHQVGDFRHLNGDQHVTLPTSNLRVIDLDV